MSEKKRVLCVVGPTACGKTKMGVLLANHGGPTGGWKAAGRSAFWNERGALVRETTGTGETLLLLERTEIDA